MPIILLKIIQLAFSNWQQPLTKQHACYQATIYKKNDSLYRPPAAVSVFNSQKITFTGISIFDTGATGFDILPFCQDIKFKKHPRYNWSNERLKVIEKLVQMQTILLLRYPSAMIKKYNPLF